MEKGESNKSNMLHILLTAAVSALIYITVLALEEIAPFGERTFLMFDLKRQYVDYYAYYRTIISGDNDIFYSFSTALGSGTLGFFAYYLTSPFLLILSLFKPEKIYLGITLVIGLKLILAAVLMDLFLQKSIFDKEKVSIKGISGAGVFLGALSWAFSGFLFAHSMNMMWMDVIILFPLYIYFLDELIKNNRKLPHIILLFAFLILNYYITYQVLLFTALWTFVRIWLYKLKSPALVIWRVFYSSMISIMLSAFLTLPTFLELMNSPKDIGYGYKI